MEYKPAGEKLKNAWKKQQINQEEKGNSTNNT